MPLPISELKPSMPIHDSLQLMCNFVILFSEKFIIGLSVFPFRVSLFVFIHYCYFFWVEEYINYLTVAQSYIFKENLNDI